MLCGYELGNLVIVQRTFLAEFVTEKPVRRKYLMSNQATCPGFSQIFLEFPLFPSSVEEDCLHFLFNWPNRASSNRLSWFRRRSASFIAWQRVPEWRWSWPPCRMKGIKTLNFWCRLSAEWCGTLLCRGWWRICDGDTRDVESWQGLTGAPGVFPSPTEKKKVINWWSFLRSDSDGHAFSEFMTFSLWAGIVVEALQRLLKRVEKNWSGYECHNHV